MPQRPSIPARPTARDLVRFHGDRARLYRAVSAILRGPDGAVDDAIATLDEFDPGGTPGADGAAAPGHETGDRSIARLVRCPSPSSPARVRLCSAAGVGRAGGRVAEIEALAALAEATARALAAGEMVVAAASSDAQAGYLSRHGGACLGRLGRMLAVRGTPLGARAGRVLRMRVRDDLALLDPGGGRR